MEHPITPAYLEDGAVNQLGSHVFETDAIIKFAQKFDPQYFHVDPVLAENSVLGGHCASGWHTISVWLRKQRDHVKAQNAALEAEGKPIPEYGPSPGMRDIKWGRPVYAGDTVFFTTAIGGKRASKSRPGWYLVTQICGGKNQHGESVLEFISTVFVRIP